MDKPQTISFWRRNLPHWRVDGRPYFVTFRLKGSIPHDVSLEMKRERDALLATTPDEGQMLEHQRRWFRRLESILDRATEGSAHLRNPAIADIVMAGIAWIEENHGWCIPAAVVMPNHVHCLMISNDQTKSSLDRSISVLKGWTAMQANRILGTTGTAFWTPEYFDHWCRTPDKTDSVVEYIRNNPVKAGLVPRREDWKWLK